MSAEALSAMARGPEGQALVKFAKDNGLPVDWCGGRISAMLSGNHLDNTNGSTRRDSAQLGGLNHEYLVQLEGRGSLCTVNLATILAMAAAYCREQQAAARDIVKALQSHSAGGKGKANGRSAGTRRNTRKSR